VSKIGLVYDAFFVKYNIDQLYQLLLKKSNIIDETIHLKEYQQYLLKSNEEMKKNIFNFTMPDDLKTYFQKSVGFYPQCLIRSLKFKKEDWCFGLYETSEMNMKYQQICMSIYLYTFKFCNTIHFLNYHHGCNDGRYYAYLYSSQEKRFILAEYPSQKQETERFELYIKRLTHELKLPLQQIHNLFLDFKNE